VQHQLPRRKHSKIQKIVYEKAIEGKQTEEIEQLKKAEEAFNKSITAYRGKNQ
jgi:hypothetical protein